MPSGIAAPALAQTDDLTSPLHRVQHGHHAPPWLPQRTSEAVWGEDSGPAHNGPHSGD